MRKVLPILVPLLLVSFVFYSVLPSMSSPEKTKKLISSQITLIDVPSVKVIYREINSPKDILPVKCDAVVPVTYTRVVSLKDLPPPERKRKFIDLLLPSILIANYEVKRIKKSLGKVLQKLERGYKLSRKEVEFVESMMDRCKANSIEEVMTKANPVPPSLVTAQAAIESGWGTSRFFVEGNNLFGMWAFKNKDKVIEAKESKVLLRRYDSVLEAVRSYIYNVNVGWAYRQFREHRTKSFDPLELSEFLSFYSIEREGYVRKVRTIIEKNGLRSLDFCILEPSYLR